MTDETTPAGRRRMALQVLSGVLSVLVVGIAVLYVLAPDRPAVTLSVGEVAGGQPYDYVATADYELASARTSARARETVYGSITSAMPVKDARLVVRGLGRRVRRQRATVRLHPAGAYRVTLHLRPGRYRVTVSLVAGHRTRTVAAAIRLRSHHSYRAAVTVRQTGVLTMLPISSY
jgi:hypothetical protein